MTKSGASSGFSFCVANAASDMHLWNERNAGKRTTRRSYTSTALCVAVATGYSCGSWNPPNGSVSSNVEGTISGARPCAERNQHLYREPHTAHVRRPLSYRKRGAGGRTKVRRMSLLRGLLDARMTRFPTSFWSAGVLRACSSTGLCFGSSTFFDPKKPIIVSCVGQ